MTEEKKGALTTTATTAVSNFDWEPDLITGGNDDSRPPRAARGDAFLKYVYPEHWTESGLPATGRILLLHDIHYVVVRWPTEEEKKQTDTKGPAESIPLERGAPEPDLQSLNAKIPEDKWPVAFGKKQPPYRLQRILEFLDLSNMDQLSWAHYTDVAGASIAVDEVRKRINTVRKLRGDELFAVVKLNHRPFPNNYNPKLERPWLEIVNWARLGPHGVEIIDVSKPLLPQQGAEAQLDRFAATAAPTQPAQSPKPLEPRLIKQSTVDVPLAEEMEDELPWK